MNKFNQAVTYSLFPNIDINVHLSPKQWTSKESMHNYFEKEVSSLFEGASYNVDSNSYFHQFNHILPYMRITKVLAKKIDCGSIVSNFIGENKAKLNNKPYPSAEYGYPFYK